MRGFGLRLERYSTGVVSVALLGELDLEHAYAFEEELRRVEADAPPCLVLDVRDLSFVDSAGLALLLSARRRAHHAGRRLVLARPGRGLRRLLALTATEGLFEIVDGDPSHGGPGRV